MSKPIAILLFLFSFGCAGLTILSPEEKQLIAEPVRLGDGFESVRKKIEIKNRRWSREEIRSNESFIDGGDTVDILFLRDRRIRDGAITDDEFTPYVFRNKKLTAIGWTAIGGPKTTGAVPHKVDVTVK